MATKFSYLETGHLGQDAGGEVSIQSLIETSDALAEEAREILPYSFDECTYSKGYLRQAIWSCIDCGEKGVCYGCSISCHAEHQLVELWTKRNFRCDCPTTSMASTSSKRCKITAPDQQPTLDNEENKYTHNFKGEFCRCGRTYDPETETEAMIQCIACEDWYHETCLDLRIGDTQPEGDEDDDETRVLIPSDTYDGLICSACVKDNEYLRGQAGKAGWMTIERVGDIHRVVGRPVSDDVPADEKGPKRERDEATDGDGVGKRVKLEGITDGDQVTLAEDDKAPSEPQDNPQPVKEVSGSSEQPARTSPSDQKPRSKGDIFLAEGIRERMSKELDAKTIASLPFELVDREIYEPPRDEDEDETLDEVTNRVMSGLPRVQAIEALHGYQDMKERLMGMLRGHVANGETVRKEDIETFFSNLKGGR